MCIRFSGVVATGRTASVLVVVACASTGCLPGRCDSDRDCPTAHVCVEQTVFRVCVPRVAGRDAGSPSCTAESCYPTEAGLADPTVGVGVCRAGAAACEDGELIGCDGAVLPTAEQCNGLDDDCDGVVDEPPEDGFRCYPTAEGLDDPTIGVGVCVAGRSMVCRGGVVGECMGSVEPMAEVCNGLDDDCDGAIDRVGVDGPPLERRCALAADCPEDPDGLLPQATDDRRCCIGIEQCEMGAWGECSGGNADGERAGEVCNGQDDDCDGTSDERGRDFDPPEEDGERAGEMAQLGFDCVSIGVPGRDDGAEDVTLGACRRYGTITCDPSAEVVACSAVAVDRGVETCTIPSVPEGLYLPQPGSERVGVPENAVIHHADEDCDGRTDEFTVPQGVTVADGAVVGDACSIGLGACLSETILTCNEAGAVVCNAEVRQPGVEVCGGGPGGLNDEDCDGRLDEAEMGVPLTVACGTSLGVCVVGTRTCIGGRFGACEPTGDARLEADPAVPEWCDGKNNDCDGAPQDADPAIDSDGLVDELCSCWGPEMDPQIIEDPEMEVRTRPMGSDRANVLRGPCGGDDAPEVVLSWTSPSEGLWRFRARDVAAQGSDPVVYLTPSCSTSAFEGPLRDELACGDDDGAMQIGAGDGGPVELPDATRFGASAVAWTAAPDDRLAVVLDGAEGGGGEWTLETQRIDRGPQEPGAMLTRPKVLVIEGPDGVSGVRTGASLCPQRVVRLDKAIDPVAVDIRDNQAGYCLDNDGAYRALQLDGGGLVREPLGEGQRISIFGRLLPQAADSADWFSVRLADLGAVNRNINIDLIPPTRVPDGVDRGFADDRRRCLGERTRLVAYVACREGVASVPGAGCQSDALTGAVICSDVVECNFDEAGRALPLFLGNPICRAADGSAVDGDPILFVGVLSAAEAIGHCACGEQTPPPDRSVTYELRISRR